MYFGIIFGGLVCFFIFCVSVYLIYGAIRHTKETTLKILKILAGVFGILCSIGFGLVILFTLFHALFAVG